MPRPIRCSRSIFFLWGHGFAFYDGVQVRWKPFSANFFGKVVEVFAFFLFFPMGSCFGTVHAITVLRQGHTVTCVALSPSRSLNMVFEDFMNKQMDDLLLEIQNKYSDKRKFFIPETIEEFEKYCREHQLV